MDSFEIEFFPDFYEDHWTADQKFTIECEYEEADPSVGLQERISWIVTSNGKDITSELNAENCAQVEYEIEAYADSLSKSEYDGD